MPTDGGNGQGGRDYSTGLRSGIHEFKHYKAIGHALWVFNWCVDADTGGGWVLGGDVLTYRDIAIRAGLVSPLAPPEELSKAAENARKQIRRLSTLVERAPGEGLRRYVEVHNVPGKGVRLCIVGSKKVHRNPGPTVRGRRLTPDPQSAPPDPQSGVYKEKTQRDSERLRDPLPPSGDRSVRTPSAKNGTPEAECNPKPWLATKLDSFRAIVAEAGGERVAVLVERWLPGWLNLPDRRRDLEFILRHGSRERVAEWSDGLSRRVKTRQSCKEDVSLDLLFQAVNAAPLAAS